LKSFRQQVKDATTEAILLAQEFGDLDPRAVAAAQKVADLRDLIDDTNTKINALNPENKFRAIQNLGGAIAGIFQVATGALQAFGVESEQATKIAQQFQGALNIFAGLQQLSQLKDSLTAVRAAFSVSTAAATAQAAAQQGVAAANVAAGTTAVGAATGIRALTAAMATNPLTAFLVGVAAISAALVVLAEDSDDAANKLEQLGNEANLVAAELEGIQSNIKRTTDENIAAIDTAIAKRKAEGAGVKVIAELEKQRYLAQGEAINRQLKANSDANREAAAQIDELRKLDDETAIEKIRAIEKEIDERNKANKDLISNGKVLKEQIKQLEIETTEAITEEAEKQREERKKALDVNYNAALEKNKQAFAAERLEASKTIGNEVQLRLRLSEITLREREKELEIAKNNGKATIAIEQSIVDAKKDVTNQKLQIVLEGLDAQFRANVRALEAGNASEEQLAAQSLELKRKLLQDKLNQIAEFAGKESELYKKTQEELADVDAGTTKKSTKSKIELLEELRKKSDEAFEKQRLDILNNSATLDEANAKIAKAEREKLALLIQTAKAQGLNTTELEAQLRLLELTDIDKVKDLQDNLKQAFNAEILDGFFTTLSNYTDQSIDDAERIKEERLKILDEEEEAINLKFENRLIGRRQLELEQERIVKERVKAEEAAEKRIAAIRKRADIATRAKALYEIFVNTRRAVMAVKADATIPEAAKPPLIVQTIALGGIQAAAVLAQPLPKYKKGTLAVKGRSENTSDTISYQGGRGTMRVVGTGTEDTELALLQPGEAVIPTETNRKYHPAIKAIYEQKIGAAEINQFVNMRLRGDITREAKASGPVMAKMDVSDLYALGRIMRKNDGVTVKNIKELASIFADNYNPRR